MHIASKGLGCGALAKKVSLHLIPDGGSRRHPLFALWSKYSPQLPILKHPQSEFFPYYKKSKQVFIYINTTARAGEQSPSYGVDGQGFVVPIPARWSCFCYCFFF
jgi:hypothetical protein